MAVWMRSMGVDYNVYSWNAVMDLSIPKPWKIRGHSVDNMGAKD